MGFNEFPGPVDIVICSGRGCKRSHLLLQLMEDMGIEVGEELTKKLKAKAGEGREVLFSCGELLQDDSRIVKLTFRQRILVGDVEKVNEREMPLKFNLLYHRGRFEGDRGLDWAARYGLQLCAVRGPEGAWLGINQQLVQMLRLGIREGFQAEGGEIHVMPENTGMIWTLTDEDGVEVPCPGHTPWWFPKAREKANRAAK